MHRVSLATLVGALMLFSASMAKAEATYTLHLHFMSKRAHHAPQDNSQSMQPTTQSKAKPMPATKTQRRAKTHATNTASTDWLNAPIFNRGQSSSRT